MKPLLTILVCLSCLTAQAAEPQATLQGVVERMAAMERQNSQILAALKDLERKVDGLPWPRETVVAAAPKVELEPIPTKPAPKAEKPPVRKVGDVWKPNEWQTTKQYAGHTETTPADRSGAGVIINFDRTASVDKTPMPLDSVPHWELTRKIGGSWVTDRQGRVVYALSRWRDVKHASGGFHRECIELYGRPVPVEMVVVGKTGGESNQQQQPTANYNFGPQ